MVSVFTSSWSNPIMLQSDHLLPFQPDCLLIQRVYFFNQAPTHSTITLSSGSESSRNGSPTVEDESSWEEPSLCKSSKIADKDKNVGKIHGENIAVSPSNKRSKLKSPEKGQVPKVEDQIPLEKKKSGSDKKKKGIQGLGRSMRLSSWNFERLSNNV